MHMYFMLHLYIILTCGYHGTHVHHGYMIMLTWYIHINRVANKGCFTHVTKGHEENDLGSHGHGWRSEDHD